MAGKWDRPSVEEAKARRKRAQRTYRESRGIGVGPAPRGDPATAKLELEYSDEEREFLTAVDRWKAETGVRFPTLTQLLAVLRGLGYRKPGG